MILVRRGSAVGMVSNRHLSRSATSLALLPFNANKVSNLIRYEFLVIKMEYLNFSTLKMELNL